jgi:hypothetical protein
LLNNSINLLIFLFYYCNMKIITIIGIIICILIIFFAYYSTIHVNTENFQFNSECYDKSPIDCKNDDNCKLFKDRVCYPKLDCEDGKAIKKKNKFQFIWV